MTYVIGSEKGITAAVATYSIDNGETFVAQPMVEVQLPDGTVEMQPAPAEAYTHVKWDFSESLDSAAVVSVSHEVTVKQGLRAIAQILCVRSPISLPHVTVFLEGCVLSLAL